MEATAAPDTAAQLREYFERKEARSLEPWRATAAKQEVLRNVYTNRTLQEQTTAFVDLCKASQLSPDDMMILSYHLYGTEEDKRFFAEVIMQHTGTDRIRAHNWRVASMANEAFQSANGPILDNLEWPLFPSVPEFSALQVTLLAQAKRGITGAGHRGPIPSVFRRQDPQGAGYLPVEFNGEGQARVDVTQVEGFATETKRRMEQYEQQIAALNKRVQELAARPVGVESSELQRPARQRNRRPAQQQQQIASGAYMPPQGYWQQPPGMPPAGFPTYPIPQQRGHIRQQLRAGEVENNAPAGF